MPNWWLNFSGPVVYQDTFSTLSPALERQQQNKQTMSLSSAVVVLSMTPDSMHARSVRMVLPFPKTPLLVILILVYERWHTKEVNIPWCRQKVSACNAMMMAVSGGSYHTGPSLTTIEELLCQVCTLHVNYRLRIPWAMYVTKTLYSWYFSNGAIPFVRFFPRGPPYHPQTTLNHVVRCIPTRTPNGLRAAQTKGSTRNKIRHALQNTCLVRHGPH